MGSCDEWGELPQECLAWSSKNSLRRALRKATWNARTDCIYSDIAPRSTAPCRFKQRNLIRQAHLPQTSGQRPHRILDLPIVPYAALAALHMLHQARQRLDLHLTARSRAPIHLAGALRMAWRVEMLLQLRLGREFVVTQAAFPV